MHPSLKKSLAGLALAGTSVPALAHTLPHAGQHAAVVDGFLHPLTGLDHLLAMVAVGFAAAQMSRALVPLALAFVGVMLLGAVAGSAGVPLPHVETGIALSVMVLGGLMVAAHRIPVAAGAGLVGLFAAFHGHAHGAEMPAGASPLLYFTGFVLATLGLHLAGYGLGRVSRELAIAWGPRLAGAGTATAGAWVLFGLG